MKLDLFRQLAYRRAMTVKEVVFFSPGVGSFPRCPRCQRTMDREYMSFCDRCGQKLDWTNFEEMAVVTTK